MWAAGDIRSVTARPVSAVDDSSSGTNGDAAVKVSASPAALMLRVHLPEGARGARVSKRLRYRLVLHMITPRGRRAAAIDVRGSSPNPNDGTNNLRAVFSPLSPAATATQGVSAGAAGSKRSAAKTVALPARRVAGGLKVRVPLRLLAEGDEPFSLLLSASTHMGTARLDQTGTGAVRITPADAKPAPPDNPAASVARATHRRSLRPAG
jgi:hypothetical protein